ncbi:MAG: Vitamin epoxide reductase [Bacteriovoracaceae bacterium]|nr:Vitamin epoxide reductase [Bacteriovoracaceae bacterium]
MIAIMWSRKQIFLVLFCAIGLGALLWSADDYFSLMRGDRLGASACSINSYWNCDKASLSPVGSWSGIPLGLFGAVWFFVVAVLGLSLPTLRVILRSLLVLGVLTAIALASYLTFKLKTGCIICYLSYAAILGATFFGWSASGFAFSKRNTFLVIAVGILGLAAFAFVSEIGIGKNISDEEFQKWVQTIEPMPPPSKLSKGPSDSKITVAEFSDFGCPFCRVASEVMLPYLSQQPDVRILYYPFPLDNSCNPYLDRPIHPHSCEWARGAVCANEQGLLWEFHDKIFSVMKQSESLPALHPTVDSFGLKMEEFNRCMADPESSNTLQALIAAGHSMNIGSTPSFFINGRRYEAIPPMFLLKKLLTELRK